MNFCFIGCGDLAHRVATEFKKSGKHNIVSVFSRTLEKASGFTKKFGGTPYTDILEAAKNEAVEGIYIVSPHGVHYHQMIQLIDCGKPIICEKAFTINSRQAKAVFEAANEKKVLVTEAMWMYFNPNIRKAKEIIDSGELGSIVSIDASLCFIHRFFHPFKPKERMFKPELGAGALLDVTVYPIALAYLFLGVPQKIFASLKMKKGFDSSDSLLFKYASGAICHLNGSVEKVRSETAVITCEKGKIVIPYFHKADSVTVFSRSGKATYKNKGAYIYEFDQFEEDFKNGLTESSIMKQKYTVDIMRIMDECRSQADFKYPEETEKV